MQQRIVRKGLVVGIIGIILLMGLIPCVSAEVSSLNRVKASSCAGTIIAIPGMGRLYGLNLPVFIAKGALIYYQPDIEADFYGWDLNIGRKYMPIESGILIGFFGTVRQWTVSRDEPNYFSLNGFCLLSL